MSKNKLGPIPDSHFENEPSGPAKNVSPLSQAWLDKIAAVKKQNETGDGDGELGSLRGGQ
jgi:hypothetical protein